MVSIADQESEKDDKDSPSVEPIPIANEAKAPEIFQELDYIDRLGQRKLTNEQLTAMLYSTHVEKTSQAARIRSLENKLEIASNDKNEKQNKCDVLEAQIGPLKEQNAVFIIIATVCFSIGSELGKGGFKYTFIGLGIMASLGALISIFSFRNKSK